MAIANSLCFRLLLCTYKAIVRERALLRAQQGVSPPNVGSGKEEPHHKCPQKYWCLLFLVSFGCRKSGVNSLIFLQMHACEILLILKKVVGVTIKRESGQKISERA